jgi:hypothetical protein
MATHLSWETPCRATRTSKNSQALDCMVATKYSSTYWQATVPIVSRHIATRKLVIDAILKQMQCRYRMIYVSLLVLKLKLRANQLANNLGVFSLLVLKLNLRANQLASNLGAFSLLVLKLKLKREIISK